MSSKHKKKLEKKLSRPCPDCEGALIKVMRLETDEGVSKEVQWVECEECGYEEKFHVAKKRSKEELILRGKEIAPKKRNDNYNKKPNKFNDF
jgi:RNase P subunit RPR2